MADYTPLGSSLVTSINQRVTVKNTPDSVDPIDVGGCITDVVNSFIPILNTINNFDVFEGNVAPANTLGVDGDLYIQDGTNFAFWKKVAGTWVNKANIDLGINIVDGNINVQSSVSGMVVTSTAGQWGIGNIIYQTATQTQFTIPTQDPNFDRIDGVFGDDANTLVYVAGTASSNPDGTKPISPSDRVIIAYIYVPSLASGNMPYIADSNSSPAGSSIQSIVFSNTDLDSEGNITYSVPTGKTVIGADVSQIIGGSLIRSNLFPSYDNTKIYGFSILTGSDTQTITIKIA